ncbi:MAG TPA: spore coat U domain-containing protein [Vicinamibacterales bacterium]|nr:spore coat U domain-containing protein [Vicinamibacterales bacterium]
MITTNVRRALTGIGMAALLGAFPASDAAAQTSDSFQVLASVAENCIINTPNALDFADYDPTSGTDDDAETTISLRCTKGTTAEVLISLGGNPSGGQRRMTGQTLSETLNYDLYTDSSRTSPWGDTAGAGYDHTAASAAWTDVTVYGRIPAGQDVSVDAYEDTVTATVNF